MNCFRAVFDRPMLDSRLHTDYPKDPVDEVRNGTFYHHFPVLHPNGVRVGQLNPSITDGLESESGEFLPFFCHSNLVWASVAQGDAGGVVLVHVEKDLADFLPALSGYGKGAGSKATRAVLHDKSTSRG